MNPKHDEFLFQLGPAELTTAKILEPRDIWRFTLSNIRTGWRASYNGGEAILLR